ncbi:MAG: peptidase, partial [Pirellulaceae bacterium]|nr:peptidase [Pirellulaceae bacterium]
TEGVAGEILQEVRELIQEHEEKETQRERIVGVLKDLIDRLGDSPARVSLAPIVREIEEDLSGNTVGRLAAFRLAMEDEAMNPAERLALAVSGWLLGSDAAATNLPNALSAFEVRQLVVEYLNEPSLARRAELMERLGSQEAAVPRTVALLLENMKPPVSSEPVEGKAGHFELEVAGLDREPPVRYLVQTPPEYDPYRTYPAVVTLHAAGVAPEEQLQWWAGSRNEQGHRVGQAGRHGYIVIAPSWLPKGRSTYGYSAAEHAVVLNCLRDACRRFAVDTDRVYLSGHSAGGEAAWDIGLAHPDLWAGVIPVTARVDRYIVHYSKNAKYVPLYFVGGEKDAGWLLGNAVDFDRYFKRGYDTTVVEYLGRGSEHYYDEILRLFDWMGRFKRDFYPRDFSCVTMRPWDSFFWWVEVDGMPEKSVVEPANWPPPHGTRPIEIRGRLLPNNNVQVRSGAARAIVWLSPKMVDFDQRVKITLNGRAVDRDASFVRPDLATMLEDARTRADRQHPFWAKVEMDTGRRFGVP